MRPALLVIAMLIGGCGTVLPTYPSMGPRDAWPIVSQSASSIRAVLAEADTTLTGDDGTSVRLDVALVMAPPDRVRLRAWKVGHMVLDVTSDGGVVWIDAPEGPAGRSVVDTLGVAPADLVHGLLLIPGWPMGDKEPDDAERRTDQYVYQMASPWGQLICEVDVRTLVVRRWRINSETGGGHSLALSGHRLVGRVPWPDVAVLRDGPRSVRLRFRHVQLDETPDDQVFEAPQGARRLP